MCAISCIFLISFEIAKLFMNIAGTSEQVDREERPDVDKVKEFGINSNIVRG